MLHDLSAQLAKAAEQKRLKEKLERDIQAVQVEWEKESARLTSLNAQLEKEQMDVDKLERTSLTALFYSILGSRDEQLEQERQELLAAQLKHGQSQHQVDYLKRELDRLKAQLGTLPNIEVEYASLLAQKENALRQTDPVIGIQLLELSTQMANLRAEEKETSEAIDAGHAVLSNLNNVIDSLSSAEGWGTWDLLGGGFIATAAKHSKIDEARDHIHDVQAGMSRFQRELTDVQKSIDLQIDISEFESFADYFFDGLIMDWIVQSKIEDSLMRAKDAKKAIVQAVKELETLKADTQSRHQSVREKRDILIEQS